MADQAKQVNPETTPRKRGSARGVTTALLLLPVIAILFPTCLVLLIGMLPSVVAYAVDRTRGKSLAITVGLINFCGTLPGIADLWREGQALTAAARIASDSFFWLVAYGAAAVGWLIYLLVPPVLASFYSIVTERRIAGMRRGQAALIEAWGEEVAGADAADPAAEE